MTDSRDGAPVQHDLTSAFYLAHRASTDPAGREFRADAHTYFPSPSDLGLNGIEYPRSTHLPSLQKSGQTQGAETITADLSGPEPDEQSLINEQSLIAEQQRPWWTTVLGITGIFIVINLLAILFGALFF